MGNQSDYTVSFRLGREALDIYHELGDTKGIAGQLNSLGINRQLYGDYAAAQSWFEQGLRVCRELGDERETAAALSNLAESVRAQGDPQTDSRRFGRKRQSKTQSNAPHERD